MDRRREIFINGRYLTQRMTGVQRYAMEVVLSLDRLLTAGTLGGGHRVTLLVPPGSFPLPALRSIRVVQGGNLSGHFWEQIDLPRLARAGLLFNPCGPSPLFHPCQVTMLPDASVFLAPEGYSFAYIAWTRLLYLSAGMRAKIILTISAYSKKKLLDHCRTLSEQKVHVVYPGSNHVLDRGTDTGILNDLFKNGRRDYVLCVGSQQANKNVKIVASVSEWLDERGISTIVTGGGSKTVFRGEEINAGRVTKTGYVSDAELETLYKNARCFIFPSFEEGFGIPPLEAMRCRCPVISSSSASMPEVCGDGAIYFDPKDVEGLKSALDVVLSNAVLADQLKARGAVQAEKYTWDQTALGVWEHLQREAAASARVSSRRNP
jgi:glycosyltransferase involved in cell wall biosynthesis